MILKEILLNTQRGNNKHHGPARGRAALQLSAKQYFPRSKAAKRSLRKFIE